MSIPEEYRELSEMLERFRRHVDSPLVAVVIAEEREGEGEVLAGHIRLSVAMVYSVSGAGTAVSVVGLSQLLSLASEHLSDDGHTTFQGGDPREEQIH